MESETSMWTFSSGLISFSPQHRKIVFRLSVYNDRDEPKRFHHDLYDKRGVMKGNLVASFSRITDEDRIFKGTIKSKNTTVGRSDIFSISFEAPYEENCKNLYHVKIKAQQLDNPWWQ